MKNTLLGLTIAILSISNCTHSKNSASVDTENCETLATVKDFTGLDGCSLLLVLDNGDKLLPSKIKNPDFVLREGQRVKMNYRILEDAMSVCMAEKASIEITCIELIEGKPVVKECYDTTDVMSIPWMEEVVQSSKAYMVKKFPFRTDGWAYLFITSEKQLFYDCQGTLLCERIGTGEDACVKRYVPGEEGKTIYSIRQ